MANESLDKRIDQLTDLPEIVVRPDGTKIPDPTEFEFKYGNVLDDLLPPTEKQTTKPYSESSTIMTSSEDPAFKTEKVDVAALNWKNIFKKTKLTPVEEEILDTIPKASMAGKPPKMAFNLDMIDSEDGIKQQIETLAQIDGLNKYKKISYKQIADEFNKPEYAVLSGDNAIRIFGDKAEAEKWISSEAKAAQKNGKKVPEYTLREQPVYSQEFVEKMTDPKYNIDPNTKTIADPYEFYKQFHFMTTVSKRAYDLGQQIVNLKRTNSYSKNLLIQFRQAVALEGMLARQIKKQQVDVARTLGVLSQARKPSKAQAELIEMAIEENGGTKQILDFAEKYVATSDRAKRTEMAAAIETSVMRRMIEIIPTTYVTGLVSGVKTHIRNITGSAALSAFDMPERFVGVGVGKLRTTLWDSQKDTERILLSEAMVNAKFNSSYWTKAFSAMWDSLRHNKTIDPYTKAEISRPGRQAFTYDLGPDYKHVSNGIQYMGNAVTVSGRILQSEDDFVKTLHYWRSIEMQAAGEEEKMLKSLIEDGMDRPSAIEQAAKHREELLQNPTEDMIQEGLDFGRYVTSTQPLTGFLKTVENVTNNPLAKLFMPFMRTTSNVIGAASERTPFTFFLTPRFYKNWNKGGKHRDLAISKVVVGSGFMYAMGTQTMNGRLTGAGPYRWEDRQALMKTGWLPFATVFNAGELSKEKIEMFKKITNVSVTKDKIYISYEGIEPISILVAMSATTAEYAYLNPKDGEMDGLAMGVAMAGHDYVTEHPLLQGMAKFTKIFTSRADDGADLLYDIMKNASTEYGQYIAQGIPTGIPATIDGERRMVGGAWSGFRRNLENMIHPERSNIAPERMESKLDPGLQSAVDGWSKAMRTVCAANPSCSESLPYARDPLTGETMKNGKGNLYDVWGPFKTSEGKIPNGYIVLAEHGVGVPKVPQTIQGVRLTATQQNNLINFATKGGRLEKQVLELSENILTKNSSLTRKEKADAINHVISQFYSAAEQELMMNDPELRKKIENTKKIKEGRFNSDTEVMRYIGD